MIQQEFSYESLGSITGQLNLKLIVESEHKLTDEEQTEIIAKVREIRDVISHHTTVNSEVFKEQCATELEDIHKIFEGNIIHIKEIANGYSPRLFNPWFKVCTRKGPIIIGHRKRVISINWEESDVTKSANELFPEEDVTKQDRLIHAWSIDKAKEYINVILKS